MTGPTNTGDDDLRRLLDDAVAGVQPHGTLADIRARTDQETPMSKRWFLPTLAVAAVMAAVVGGAFWLLDDDQKVAPSGTPTHHASPTPAAPSESPDLGTQERAVPVYYVGDTAHGKKLFREFHRVSAPSTGEIAGPAVGQVLGAKPADPDYVNLWSGLYDGKYGVTSSEDLITVNLHGDLHDRPAGMSEGDAGLAIQQLIYSAQAGFGQGRIPVQFLLDGKPTDTILGVPASEPLAAANPDKVQAPVQIDSPADGDEVSGTFTVTGRAAAFEANVAWELKQGDTTIKDGFTTAQECCTLSPYSFQVTAPPGSYTLVVHDTDESGGGRPVDQDTKEITVK
jgi:hypothetical protein